MKNTEKNTGDMDNNHYCVIMAGGNGSRLWPASTTACPKQFMDIAETGKTSIRNTYDRFSSIVPKDNILVVTVRKYRDLVLRDIPELKEENLLLEPYARDTAPCIAYAAYTLFKRNPQATMVMTPADHLIDDDEKFREAIVRSIEFVSENNVLMTLGITPTRPDPNFGYIQITGGSAALQKAGAIKVKTFTEKPDVSLAKVFIASGEFFWNSGIFVWTAETIIREMEKHLPEVTRVFSGWEHAVGTPMEEEFISRAYTDCVKISIDYGVMEKTDKAWLYPADFGWSDVGTWESLYGCIGEKDMNGNIFNTAKILTEDSHDVVVYSSTYDKLVAVKGLENYVVIDTGKALLICPKDDKKLKEFTARLSMPGFENYR
jgi:mannose-1-phosphate guanylyltransferase